MSRIDLYDNRSDMVRELIRTGRYDLIPASKMSKPFEEENPWPPPQFTNITDETKFCTWCGETIDRWTKTITVDTASFETVHVCPRYGKHCRHKDLGEDAFYMRVWSYGRTGRHHYNPDRKQTLMVKNLNSGALQLVSPNYRPPLQSHMFKEPYVGYDEDEDDVDDCECCCEICTEENPSDTHCGFELNDCNEKRTVSTVFRTPAFETADAQGNPDGWRRILRKLGRIK